MNYATSFRKREGHAVVARDTDRTMAAIEEHSTRLRSWAAIIGVTPAGAPFLRLTPGKVTVNLPIANEIETNGETGVHASVLCSGTAMYVEDVPFAEIERVVDELLPDLSETWVSAGPVEFHRGPDGFGSGTLVLPLRALTQAATPTPLHTAVEPQARAS